MCEATPNVYRRDCLRESKADRSPYASLHHAHGSSSREARCYRRWRRAQATWQSTEGISALGFAARACGRMQMATFSHRRSVLSMLCLTMQQQQRRSAQHQRHRSHRWNAQLLQQHLKARISLWISATQTQAMQRFLRNPWQRYVPLLRDSPYVEPCWCAHLHSLGLYGGAMMTSYVEGRLQEQAGRYRRHSV